MMYSLEGRLYSTETVIERNGQYYVHLERKRRRLRPREVRVWRVFKKAPKF